MFLIPYSTSGPNKPSPLVTFTTKEDSPEVFPRTVELKLVNSTSAVVKWMKPLKDGINGQLTGFKMEIFANQIIITNFTLEPTATSLILSNLTKGVIYSVRIAAFNRAGQGPYTKPVSLKVEPSLLYQPRSPYPSLPPSSGVLQETWFVSIVGVAAILTIVVAALCVVLGRRKVDKKKELTQYKDGSSPLNYLESDTLWINPKSKLLVQTSEENKGSHLYINNMNPPEYAELEGGKKESALRNMNHTSSPCYASTSVTASPMKGYPPLPPPPLTHSSGSEVETGGGEGGGGSGSGMGSTAETTSGTSGSGGSRERRRRSRRSERRGSGSDSSKSGEGESIYVDPGLPPVPPLRGLSSYQGVKAGSLSSFGVIGGGGGDYSIPGLPQQFRRTSPSCHCCQSRVCSNSNSHYESASIYRECIINTHSIPTPHNKIYFSTDGQFVNYLFFYLVSLTSLGCSFS